MAAQKAPRAVADGRLIGDPPAKVNPFLLRRNMVGP
jgi:hypothetical protein